MAKITKEKIKGCVKGSALTIATLCGVIGGIILGISLKEMKGMIFMETIVSKCHIHLPFLSLLINIVIDLSFIRFQIKIISMDLTFCYGYNIYCIII